MPAWITACMRSVERWCSSGGWSYEKIDDAFFNYAPAWAREHCGKNIYAITDICRLEWLREKLNGEFERVIWADADILIFNPDLFQIPPGQMCGFAHELFVRVERNGALNPTEAINNAVMVFGRDQSVLNDYLSLCFERLRQFPSGKVPRTALGPELIAELNRKHALPLIYGVGLFTLAVMGDVARGGGPVARKCVKHSPRPLGAANLCHFLRNDTPPENRPQFDALYYNAVQRLLDSQGEVLTA